MNTTRMPGFSAEASFYRSSAHYQAGTMLAGLKQGEKGMIHPALRAVGCDCFNSMKGRTCCCWGFGVASCCISGGSCETFSI